MKMLFRSCALLLSLVFLATACSGPAPDAPVGKDERARNRKGGDASVFGDTFDFGGSDQAETGGSGTGIGVNSFLWRASLDTISFMPLSQADPFGGVIITDWYAPPETPSSRFKLNLFILGRELRADGLRISVFKQQRNAAGAWVDTPVSDDTIVSLENAILERARELRVATLAQ